MEKMIRLHRKIAPEFIAVIEDRYNILKHIQSGEPIGRRALAVSLGMGERVVRAQVDFLKSAGLVDATPLGMTITAEGREVLGDLTEYVRQLYNLTALEQDLTGALGVERVVIIPGDSDDDDSVQRQLGRAASGILEEYLADHMIIAVSGGSTMARMAEAVWMSAPGTTVVPARGGLGERVEYQANIIAAVMAAKLGGKYRLLHIPDSVSEEALEVLSGEAQVCAVLDMIRHADILCHGIGTACNMAKRRNLDARVIEDIAGRGAVGEALGFYYSLAGECVYVTNSVGLSLDEIAGIKTVIAVAGGRAKAEAIVAVAKAGGPNILVIDEAAARTIQTII
jgi:central glycolytic genes regulator